MEANDAMNNNYKRLTIVNIFKKHTIDNKIYSTRTINRLSYSNVWVLHCSTYCYCTGGGVYCCHPIHKIALNF